MKLYCSWAPSSLHRHRYFHRLHCSQRAHTFPRQCVYLAFATHTQTHSHSVNVDEIAGRLFKWVQNEQDGPYTVWTLPNEQRANGKKMERIIYSTKKIKIMHKVWIKYVHFLGRFCCVCVRVRAWIWIRCAITLPLLAWWKMQRPDLVYFVIERNEITRNLWQTFKCSFADSRFFTLLSSLHFNGKQFTFRFSLIMLSFAQTVLQMHLYFVGFHILSNNFPNCFNVKFTYLRFPVYGCAPKWRSSHFISILPFTFYLSSESAFIKFKLLHHLFSQP